MKKKKSIVGRVFRAVGILILAAVVIGASYILTSGKRADRSGAAFGDLTAEDFIPASTGTAAHLSFTENAEMRIAFDEGDLLYFFSRAAGKDWLEKARGILSPFGLELTGVGVDIEPEGIHILAELRRGRLLIPVEAKCEVEYENKVISISAANLSVLGIRFKPKKVASKLGYSIDNLKWTYEPKNLFMEGIDKLELQEGFLMVSGSLETDFLRDTTVSEARSLVMRFGQKSSCYAGAVLNESTCDDPGICYAPILPRLMETPGFYTTFLSQLFRVLTPGTESMTEMNYGMIYRWFPELQSSYSKERTEETGSFEMHGHALDSLTEFVLSRYCGKKLQIKDGEFLYNKERIDAEDFYSDNYITYHNLYRGIDEGRFCLCLLKEEGHKGMPRLLEICDSTESIAGNADKSTRYALGIVMRGADGSGYVLVFSDDGYQIIPVTEEEFIKLINASNIPLLDMTAKTEDEDLLNQTVTGKELMCAADTVEEAETIAELYGIELVEYSYGIAVFHTGRPARDIIKEGLAKGWPELSENTVLEICAG